MTVGGAVAADIHGKNHHRDGTFGAQVVWLDLVTADGALHGSDRTPIPTCSGRRPVAWGSLESSPR